MGDHVGDRPEPIYDPAAVTAAWLTDVLHADHALPPDDQVVGFTTEAIGTGQVGANIRYRLTYAAGLEGQRTDGAHVSRRPDDAARRTTTTLKPLEGSGVAAARRATPPTRRSTHAAYPLTLLGDRPASVVTKFAAADEVSRSTGIATRTYETEVAFYRDLAATVDISRPHCFFAAIEPGTADVVLVLEDLAPAVQGDQIAGCTVDQARLAVREAARLHGPRWGDPTLLDHPWLAEAVEGGGDRGAAVANFLAMCWPGFVDRYRAMLDDAALEVGARLAEGVQGWMGRQPPALTLTHGDYRLDNMLFAPDPTPGAPGEATTTTATPTTATRPLAVVDWQTVRLGCGTSDVAYFLGAGLDPAVRRAHEAELVAEYHRALGAYGVADYPLELCWEDYRHHSFGGYLMAVIASMLVGRTDRGDAMFMAMANRHAAQVTDLDALMLL